MKRIILLMGLMLVIGGGVGYGEEDAGAQSMNIKHSETRTDKMKAFVDGFEIYAKKIIDDYKKEIDGVDAKNVAEKYHKMMDKIGQYFRDADFSLDEWLLIQQKFDERYETSGSELDKLGSDAAYGTIRHYSEENLKQNLNGLLKVISDKNRSAQLRIQYINYIREKLHKISYYPNEKSNITISNEMKDKIVDVLAMNISDKRNDLALRKEMVFLLAGYFGGNEKAVNIVLNILDDPNENEEVKVQAIFGAGLKFGITADERVIKKLTSILANRNNYSANIVNETIKELCCLNNKDAIKVGIEVLNTTEDRNLFIGALSSLNKTNDKEAIKAVLKNNLRLGINTVDVLFQTDDTLIDIMKENSEEYTILAIKALGANVSKDPAGVMKVLEEKLYSPDPKIRLVAIDAITRIGQRENTETKNEILAILNKAKAEEKNEEVLREIENSIKSLESEQ